MAFTEGLAYPIQGSLEEALEPFLKWAWWYWTACCLQASSAVKEDIVCYTYRVSQQVWSTKRTKKCCILLQKMAFSAFFLELQNWNGSLKQLFSNLLNKSLHNTMEKGCFKKAIFSLQFTEKGWKRHFLESNTAFLRFFVNVARFAGNHFWASYHVI